MTICNCGPELVNAIEKKILTIYIFCSIFTLVSRISRGWSHGSQVSLELFYSYVWSSSPKRRSNVDYCKYVPHQLFFFLWIKCSSSKSAFSLWACLWVISYESSIQVHIEHVSLISIKQKLLYQKQWCAYTRVLAGIIHSEIERFSFEYYWYRLLACVSTTTPFWFWCLSLSYVMHRFLL